MFENLRNVLELRPVQLQVRTRREVPVVPVIRARDECELAKLFRVQKTIRNGDAQHRSVPLDVEAIAKSQGAELVLGQLSGKEPAGLIAEFSDALVDHRLVDLVVPIHGPEKYCVPSPA